MTTNVRLVSVDQILTFLYMALNDYRDLSHSWLWRINRSIDEVNDSEANGMTTPKEKAKLRTEIERQTITERMADFWKDYEAWQNPWVIRPSDYTPSRLT